MDQLGEEAEAPAFGGSAPRGGLLAHFGSQNCLDAVMPLRVGCAPFVFAISSVRRWQLPCPDALNASNACADALARAGVEHAADRRRAAAAALCSSAFR